jgi:uncharacterized protein YndB with AHSA1/START domain
MMIRKETEIARAVEAVFDYVADPRNELEWHPRVRSMEKTSEGPIGPGTTFRGDYKGSGWIDFTLVEYERPTYLRFTGGNGQASLEASIRFRERAGATYASFDLRLEPRGAFKIVMPLLGAMIRRQYAHVMPALKGRLEAQEHETRAEAFGDSSTGFQARS